MDIDLRVSVGLFFVIIGLLMGIFGLTGNPALYDRSLGISVNLYGGLAELIFGSLTIAFGRAGGRAPETGPPLPRAEAAPAARNAAGQPPRITERSVRRG